jgi:hypothetical protein
MPKSVKTSNSTKRESAMIPSRGASKLQGFLAYCRVTEMAIAKSMATLIGRQTNRTAYFYQHPSITIGSSGCTRLWDFGRITMKIGKRNF